MILAQKNLFDDSAVRNSETSAEAIAQLVETIRPFHKDRDAKDIVVATLTDELQALNIYTLEAILDALNAEVVVTSVNGFISTKKVVPLGRYYTRSAPASAGRRSITTTEKLKTSGEIPMTDNNPHPHDRAAVVTTAVLQIVRGELLCWLHRDLANPAGARAAIETLMRTEFADVARTTATETRHEDD